MATLAGQRATFTWALNRYNSTDDVEHRTKFAKQMAKTIAAAPSNGFTIEEVTQGQSYPAAEVEKYLNDPAAVAVEPGISEEESSESLAKSVEATDVIRDGQGNGTVYAYGYKCAPDRLKVGSTDGDTVQRIAAQISTSTPDRPALVIEIKTNACRALERAMHGILETRGRKVSGGGTEWFKTTRDELMEIYQFICKN
ncbi:MAG: GIY-YIG nuclease family protein [Rhodoplanes sp.]